MRGTQSKITMIEATMPMIASGLQPSSLNELAGGAAGGAAGTVVYADIVPRLIVQMLSKR